jgi:hypothetical protein
MKVSATIVGLAAALAALPLAAATAAPAVRPLSAAPVLQPWRGGERHAFWRNDQRDGDFRRHPDFLGSFCPVVDEAGEPGPEAAPAPWFVSAPVAVNVTFAPAAGPTPGWSDGPKLIVIGRPSANRRRLPLVVYGD